MLRLRPACLANFILVLFLAGSAFAEEPKSKQASDDKVAMGACPTIKVTCYLKRWDDGSRTCKPGPACGVAYIPQRASGLVGCKPTKTAAQACAAHEETTYCCKGGDKSCSPNSRGQCMCGCKYDG